MLTSTTEPRSSRALRGALLAFLAGMLCFQTAWILSVPAFRGTDEIDHAYRAASVVRGDIGPATQPVPDGRGLLVMVPADLVDAARPACDELAYVGPDNCDPVTPVDADGRVGIASASGAYLPVYYAVVGLPSLVLTGEAALYGMRVVSMLLTDVLLVLAAAIALRRGSRWHQAGLVLCLTPAVVYASIITAPNAIAMAGGLLMWVAWTAADPSLDHRDNRRYGWWGVVGAICTVAAHNTGPIWVLLTIAALAWTWRPRPSWRQALRHLGPGALAIFAAATTVAGWALFAGANSPANEIEQSRPDSPPLPELALLPVRWLFQSVFGAPRPAGMTSMLIYALVFTLLFLFVVAGFLRAEARVRQVMVLLVLVLTAFPFALTLLTYDAVGFAWQGRYSIPLGVGITILAAAALHRTTPLRTVHLLAVVPLAVVQVGSIISARANVATEGAEFLVPAWVAPVLALVGVVLWAGYVHRSRVEVVDDAPQAGPTRSSAVG